MKHISFEKCICLLFCVFLAGFFLLFLLLPKRSFSENEKRYLTDTPKLNVQGLLSGEFAEQAEAYMADHLPGRDFLVGLNAQYDLLSGRQTTKDIYKGYSGRLYEAPVVMDETQVQRSLRAVREFAAVADCPVSLLLVPSAGRVLRQDLPTHADPYPDEALLEMVESEVGADLRALNLLPLMEGYREPGDLYYKTDHHWTSRGAQLAAAAYLRQQGRTPLPEEAYTVEVYPGFYGTTYSRSALWNTPAESIELWDSGGGFLVENRDSPGQHAGLFYPEHLQEVDKYPVYLDGNHSLVSIRNLAGKGSGRLLLIRDSFANCLGCFLSDAYEEVVLVDLRYYRNPVSELLAEQDFDEVLFVYGVNNFLSDSNLMRLE